MWIYQKKDFGLVVEEVNYILSPEGQFIIQQTERCGRELEKYFKEDGMTTRPWSKEKICIYTKGAVSYKMLGVNYISIKLEEKKGSSKWPNIVKDGWGSEKWWPGVRYQTWKWESESQLHRRVVLWNWISYIIFKPIFFRYRVNNSTYIIWYL